MSYLLMDGISEKIELTKKIVKLTIFENKFSLEECQYLIDTLLLLDILNSELTDEVKNLFTDIQQDLAYYDSDSADYNYFGNEVFLEKLKIFYNLLNDNF